MKSKKIAISFLGLGPRNGYGSTNYQFENGSFETNLMPHAVYEAIQPDELIVVGTEKSNVKYREALSKHCSFTSLTVPNGRSEKEWWQVFDTITSAIPESADLTIDITHGFRSLPVIALSIALYLEAARNVNVEGILYAPYDPQSTETTPVLNLAPFLDMIEWSVAARQFVRDGNADVLARKMDALQGNAHRRGVENPPVRIKPAGDQLKDLAEALSVVRTEEVAVERAGTLIETLSEARRESSEASIPGVKPLGELLKQAQDRVRPFETDALFSEQGFAAQAEMMRFLLETNQLQQAVTLAREAMISYQAVSMDLSPEPATRDEQESSGRSQATHALGALAHEVRSVDSSLSDQEKKVAQLWNQITNCRNDINHAGMNADPKPGHRLAAQVHNVVNQTIAHITSSRA